MEIKLGKDDITKLIQENYSGINDIKIDDKIEIILIVEDMNAFYKMKAQDMKMVTQHMLPRKITLDEKNKVEAKKGVMVSGGRNRSMIRMG